MPEPREIGQWFLWWVGWSVVHCVYGIAIMSRQPIVVLLETIPVFGFIVFVFVARAIWGSK